MAVDFAANAASLGARAVSVRDRASLDGALRDALSSSMTSVVVVPVDRNARVGGYDALWDVPVAETSTLESVRDARAAYERDRKRQRRFL